MCKGMVKSNGNGTDLAEVQAQADPVGREGVGVLGRMSDAAFTARLYEIKKGRDRLVQIQQEVLKKGIDWDELPGARAPVLLKPGAETLCLIFGIAPSSTVQVDHGDGITAPPIRYTVTTRAHLGSTSGPVIAEATGSASSWETKHRYRYAKPACPACGAVGTINRSKYPPRDRPKDPPGFYCHKEKGCNAQFAHDDRAITDQPRGIVDNPDPHDLDNTLLQMADKRSFVAVVRRATGASRMFTQDLEDMTPEQRAGEVSPVATTNEGLIRPYLDRLSRQESLADFDAETETIRGEAAALSDAARALLGHKAGIMRKALEAVEKSRAPIQEPPEAAAKREEIRAALREEREPGDEVEPDDDGPPPDAEAGLALIAVMRDARTATLAEKLWAKVQTTPTFKAATEGAREVATKAAKKLIADLSSEQAARQNGVQ